MTVAGKNVKYPNGVGTPTAEMAATNIILNSTLSTQNAKFMTLNIKKMYLQTVLDLIDYMKIPYDIIPEDSKRQYKLSSACSQ